MSELARLCCNNERPKISMAYETKGYFLIMFHQGLAPVLPCIALSLGPWVTSHSLGHC